MEKARRLSETWNATLTRYHGVRKVRTPCQALLPELSGNALPSVGTVSQEAPYFRLDPLRPRIQEGHQRRRSRLAPVPRLLGAADGAVASLRTRSRKRSRLAASTVA